MEENNEKIAPENDCIYFCYPRNYNLKLVKQVLQEGFLASINSPSLLEDTGCQSFTEEDVINRGGIENICKDVVSAGQYSSCVVLKIPKAYVGNDKDFVISPIFSQVVINDNNMGYGPMPKLIYGVYSKDANGFVENTAYSPVCNSYGVLTDEQRMILEKKIGIEIDALKAKAYQDMINRDAWARKTYLNTVDLSPEQIKDLEDFYLKHDKLKFLVCPWQSESDYVMTDDEFQNAININRNRYNQM